jgi:hypothetical protein
MKLGTYPLGIPPIKSRCPNLSTISFKTKDKRNKKGPFKLMFSSGTKAFDPVRESFEAGLVQDRSQNYMRLIIIWV